jgi:Big-like domain-containing protein
MRPLASVKTSLGAAVAAVLLLPAGAAAVSTPVRVASPFNGATVSGSVAFTASATGRPRSVAFSVDGAVKSTDTAAPYRYGSNGTLDTTKLSRGTHTLSVRARYASTVRNSPAIRVYVDKPAAVVVTPLTVRLTAPARNAQLSGQVDVTAEAKGGSGGVKKVEFWADGTLRSTDTSGPFGWKWNTSGLSGSHLVGAVAFDARGARVRAADVPVTVRSSGGSSPDGAGAGPSGGGTTAWSSGFDASTWYSEWDGVNPTNYQPQFWPQSSPIGPIDPASEGVAPSHGKVMRFPMTQPDVDAGRVHSKLFKTWNINGPSNGWPGLGGDVSGIYSARAFWPSSRSISCSANATALMMGFKETAKHGSIQDSTYWMTVVPTCWAANFNNAHWVRPKPTDPNAPVVFFRWWNHGQGSNDAARSEIYVMPLPRGRWFDMRAELHDHAYLDWYVDGEFLGRGQDAVYPVGPQYGRAPEDRWQFEIGNYGRALGTTYFDDVSFSRFHS